MWQIVEKQKYPKKEVPPSTSINVYLSLFMDILNSFMDILYSFLDIHNLFADDCVCYREIKNEEDTLKL